jgi:predicted phosphodiesterase
MRWAVVSDIHGNLPALQAVWAEIEAAGVEGVINLGDILSGPLWPSETAAFLMARPGPTIAGNHERQLLDQRSEQGASDAFAAAALTPAQRAWVAALPAQGALGEGAVRLFHGTPLSDHEPWLETVTPDFAPPTSAGLRPATAAEILARAGKVWALGAQVLLCGHTHLPRLAWVDRCLLLNPGSVGLPAYDHDLPHRHHVENGSPHARWALLSQGAKGWQAELRQTAYDWERAAARAEQAGRLDWADALRSGRVGRTRGD